MKIKFNLIFTILIFFIFLLLSGQSAHATKLKFDDLYSNNVIVMENDTGTILFNKYGNKKVYPASTTKIVTAILVIENLDLDTPITASKNAIYSTPLR